MRMVAGGLIVLLLGGLCGAAGPEKGGDISKGEVVDRDDWPAGLKALANAEERVHGHYMNGSHVLYYAGDTKALNRFLSAYAALKGISPVVYLSGERGKTGSYASKDRTIPYDWAMNVFRQEAGPSGGPVWRVAVAAYLGGQTKAEDVKTPAGVLVRRMTMATPEPPPAVASPNEWRRDAEHPLTSRVILQPTRPVVSRESLQAEIDTLKRLLAAKAIDQALYEAEVKRLEAALETGPSLDSFRGQMRILTRLYHSGLIDTDTFLKFHTPVWDRWYRTSNLLENGDFEEAEDRKAPPRMIDLVAWREYIFGYGDIGHSRVEFDREVKRSGTQSLKFTCTRGPALIALYSVPFHVRPDESIKIRFWAKADRLKRGYTGRAGTVNFALSDGSLDLRPALRLYIPEGTYGWTRMEGRLQIFGSIPEGKEEPCRLAIEFFGEGTLWIDDVVVVPTTRRE